jgi:FMN phosphatase YigB (HAD superfamily)
VGTQNLDTVFIDVGGTLWPNNWPLTPETRDQRLYRFAAVLGSDLAAAGDVLGGVVGQIDEGVATMSEHPDAVIARVLCDHGCADDAETIRKVRHAFCLNLGELVTPFAHAGDLLRGISDLGLACVVLSNTTFRDAEMYQRDFDVLGWSQWISAYITSVDVGYAKPDKRIFEAAVAKTGSAPSRCVMVGNSEHADIAPAARLGMRTILVAIEDPFPATSSANYRTTRLEEVLEAIRGSR